MTYNERARLFLVLICGLIAFQVRLPAVWPDYSISLNGNSCSGLKGPLIGSHP
jgi:hypothetical protein